MEAAQRPPQGHRGRLRERGFEDKSFRDDAEGGGGDAQVIQALSALLQGTKSP